MSIIVGLVLLAVGGKMAMTFSRHNHYGLGILGVILAIIGIALIRAPFDEAKKKADAADLKRRVENRVRMEEEAREKIKKEMEKKN